MKGPLFITLAMSVVMMATTVNAQPRGMMGVAEELNLTDDQIEKMEAFRFEHQKAMIQKRADLKTARLELKELMRKAKVDRKAAISRQEKISSVRSETARMKLDHRLQVRDLLSEDQVKKWQEFHREKRSFGREHGGSEHKGAGKGPHRERGHGGKDCPGR